MKVTLKKIKFYGSMSEETNAFTADVYVDGKCCGFARNDGRGGCTNVMPTWLPDKIMMFRECESWLKTQPQINIGSVNDPYMVNCDMESMVDMLFEQWLIEQTKKKIEKKMLNHVMWGVIGGNTYKVVKFLKPLKDIDREILQKMLNKYKQEFKTGEQFLNTNLEGFIL